MYKLDPIFFTPRRGDTKEEDKFTNNCFAPLRLCVSYYRRSFVSAKPRLPINVVAKATDIEE